MTLNASQVRYITGRERTPGQINGKSENLNNALRNVIFKDYQTPGGATDWQSLPANEMVVVFDADMRAKPDFFLKVGPASRGGCMGS